MQNLRTVINKKPSSHFGAFSNKCIKSKKSHLKSDTITYLFSFNGQEKDDEISGAGNTMTAEFWVYDVRLARRSNLDPIDQVSISNYVVFRNNPIIFVDPNGAEVINGDQLNANKANKNLSFWSNEKSKFMSDNNITDKTKKRDFLKSGGTKSQWNEYTKLKSDVNMLQGQADFWNGRAALTENIITRWKNESSGTFNEVNNKEVDFILVSKDLSTSDHGGANKLVWDYETGIDFSPIGFSGYSKPAMTVEIDQNVLISQPDLRTGQYNLNHEAGHFLYIVENSEKYYQYLKKLKDEKRDYNGGHNDDDESGDMAKSYGGRK
jgi:RHS repeat-associated protein